MKKLLILLALFGMVSCNKVETKTSFAKVSFGYSFGREITKSGENELLKSLCPTTLDLVLTDSNGKTYTCATNETILLPNGEYVVTHTPTKPENSQPYNGDLFYTIEPLLSINENITINGDGEIVLHATYESAAIMWSWNEVVGVNYTTQLSAVTKPLNTLTIGDMGVVFVNGTTAKTPTLTFDAKSSYKNFSFTLNTTDPSAGYYIQKGYFYIVNLSSPKGSCLFPIEFADWQEGFLR